MFGKSKNELAVDQREADVQVMAIPDEFYGGKNPVVKFKTVEKEINPALPKLEKVVVPVTAPAAAPVQPVNALSSRRTWIVGSIVLFILFSAGTAWYYLSGFKKAPISKSVVSKPPVSVPVVVPSSTVPIVSAPTSTPVVVATSTVVSSTAVSLNGGSLEFPSLLLGNTQDVDHDGLTDAEEVAFGTDPELPDTDGDEYSDSTEINNLYSPTEKAPTRLIDTNSVKDYTNPTFGYRVYYPANWVIGPVDAESRDVLFSTLSGDNIEMRVFDKKSDITFENWFAEWAKGEHLSSVLGFYSMFKVPGYERSDRLVYYFTDETHVYVMAYRAVPGSNQVGYRNVITMLARSFRLSTTPNTLPEQAVVAPAAATNP